MSRSGGHVLGLTLSVGFGGWDSAEPVHQALLAEPGDVVGGCTVTDATRLAGFGSAETLRRFSYCNWVSPPKAYRDRF